MRRRGYSKLSVQSVIALVLLVVSFLMLMLPWAGISIEVLGRDYSLPELLEIARTYEGTTETQFNLEMQSNIAELTAEIADATGVVMNAQDFGDVMNRILDGGISLLDVATISTFTTGLLNDLDKAFAVSFSEMSATERVAISQITDAKTSALIISITLWAVIAVLVALFVYAVYSLLNNRKNGLIAYAAATAVPFVGFIVFVLSFNDAMQTYSSVVTGLLSELVRVLGSSSSSLLNFEIFHLTLAPFVCLICVIGAVLVLRARIASKIPSVNMDAINKIAKWQCPSCGTQNGVGNAYCSVCGSKRPEKPRCECGAEVKEGAAFCGKCGRKLSAIEKPAYTPPVNNPPVYTPPTYVPTTPHNSENNSPYAPPVNSNPGINQGGGNLRGTLSKPSDMDLG